MDKTRKTSKSRPRRSFSPAFKAEAVRLCRIGDRSVASVAKDPDLSVSALASVMRARGSPRGVLAHSDGGGIYGDEDYLKKLEEHGVNRSMNRKQNPWDNAVIESFCSTLRFELLCRTRFADPDEAERGISEWIERFYNLHRRHTTLRNVSPNNDELIGKCGSRGHNQPVHGIEAGSGSFPLMSRVMHGLLTAMLSVGSGLLLWMLLVDVGAWIIDVLGFDQLESAAMTVWAFAMIVAFGTATFFVARWRATRAPVVPALVGYVLFAATWIIFESAAQNGLVASVVLLMNSVVVLIAARLGAEA